LNDPLPTQKVVSLFEDKKIYLQIKQLSMWTRIQLSEFPTKEMMGRKNMTEG
jgi:hypothetical protein